MRNGKHPFRQGTRLKPARNKGLLSARAALVPVLWVLLHLCLCGGAKAEEPVAFANEGKKLEFILKMLKTEKYLRPSDDGSAECARVMKDFLSGKKFKAVEPAVQTDSLHDPRLKKWNQCENRMPGEFGIDPDYFYRDITQLGIPPLRCYQVKLDGKAGNGPEDVLYYGTGALGGSGYAWVDLAKCEEKGRFPVATARSNMSEKPKAAYLNLLVRYDGKVWVVDFIDGFSVSMTRITERGRLEIFRWLLFKPE